MHPELLFKERNIPPANQTKNNKDYFRDAIINSTADDESVAIPMCIRSVSQIYCDGAVALWMAKFFQHPAKQ